MAAGTGAGLKFLMLYNKTFLLMETLEYTQEQSLLDDVNYQLVQASNGKPLLPLTRQVDGYHCN